mmetsp:Transcript_17004/g.36865  ORF Transcript_17004/g.36865 Transcript_17004/m.36865 type:complete len:461 (-) Transcript_17004:74-1456(-)
MADERLPSLSARNVRRFEQSSDEPRTTPPGEFVNEEPSPVEVEARDVQNEARALAAFRMAAARAVSTKNAGLLVPKDSLYGSVIVLPQIARSLGNHPTYVGKALVAWICLLMVLVMQGAFVVEVYRMVADKDSCCETNPDACHKSGFVEGGTALWGLFGDMPNRWYLCHMLADPNHKAQILRKLCVIAFVICLFKDLRQTYELFVLLWELPNEKGTWMVISPQEEELIRVDSHGRHTIVRETDHQIQWQVDPLELHWKMIVFCFVLVPKLIIFAALYFYGSMWLLSVSNHQELITNAVALVFVLELDEAVFAAVTTSDVQQHMDNLQAWNPFQKGGHHNEPVNFQRICEETTTTDTAECTSEWSASSDSDRDNDQFIGSSAATSHLNHVLGNLETAYPWVQQALSFGYLEMVLTGCRVLTFPVLLAGASYLVIGWHDYHCSKTPADVEMLGMAESCTADL